MITHLARPEEVAGGEVEVAGPGYRHLFRARRLTAGARVRVVDGRGTARWSEVARVERGRAVLTLGEEAPANEPEQRLELVVAALRSERASWLVEKATEVGVSAIRFIGTERTPRRYGRASLERLRRVAASALVQCHRSRLPEISGVDPWERLPALLAAGSGNPGEAERFYLDPVGGPAGAWRTRAASSAVLVGPEGGWSPAERDELERLGCRPVSLGPRILRVETAAVVAAARLLLG